MTRIDRVVLGRLGVSFLVTLGIFFGLVILAELLQVERYTALIALGGPGLALIGLLARAGRWVLDTLPLIVLIGTVAGLLRLESSREMTMIKAAGHSIWRILRAPAMATVLIGILAAGAVQPLVVAVDRSLTTGNANTGQKGGFWIEEKGPDHDYVLGALRVMPGGGGFEDVSVFGLEDGSRLAALRARLGAEGWVLSGVTRFRPGILAEELPTITLPATTTPGDIAARLGVLDDLTIYELGGVVLSNVTDRVQRARTITRLYRLLALPFSLFGSVVIAFAFTAGYRRVNRVGSEMLYGILVGFVVYIVSELAGRAGYAGTLHPLAAVLAPAALALIGGATVLLHREDGLR